MIQISNEQFQELINLALETLPEEHSRNLRNVAILYADEPSEAQRRQLQLRNDQTLFGLYEGVPLAFRQGQTKTTPDVITLFKGPLAASVDTIKELQEAVRHTLWHEVAHYYGLNHDQIHNLE